jgi:hypothetical protein
MGFNILRSGKTLEQTLLAFGRDPDAMIDHRSADLLGGLIYGNSDGNDVGIRRIFDGIGQ